MTTILQQRTIAGDTGNWAGTVSFNQFDPSSGIFLDAIFMTAGTLGVSASIENLAPVAATVNFGVAGTIVASAPNVGVVASLTPAVNGTVNLGAYQGIFDGNLDFGGPSGTVISDLTASGTQWAGFVPAPAGTGMVSPFHGTGSFDVEVSSHATSTVNGNGNLAVLLHGSSDAVVSLQYDVILPNEPGGGYGSSGDTSARMSVGVIYANFVSLTTTVPQVVTLPSQITGWTGTASFNQFDPSLGELIEVHLNVGNVVAGTFSAENLERTVATVNMTETASMSVAIPGTYAYSITSTASSFDNVGLGAFDGAMDFSGLSGRADTTAQAGRWNGAATLTGSAALAAFAGTGTIALPVSTAGTSTVTGPANLLSAITQHTGGTVTVSYSYAPWNATSSLDSGPSSGPFGDAGGPPHPAAIGSPGLWAAQAPGMTFIGSSPTVVRPGRFMADFDAHPGETFRIESGATATLSDFSLTGGIRLDLTGLLAGAALAPDLSNLGAFVTAGGYLTDMSGGIDTTLSVHGPGGAATLKLVGGSAIAVADLLNDNALILPSH